MRHITRILATIFMTVVKYILRGIYWCLKRLPNRNKVLFLSRQSNKPSIDFLLLQEALRQEDPNVEIAEITRRLDNSLPSVLRFSWYSLLSMYHLATAKACVLDTYWPTVSILNHEESLLVLQIWHAIGKLKQSGYQILDRKYGRGSTIAEVMNMHRGYDVVVAGSKTMNDYYCASFGVGPDQLFNVGLPRIDYLLDNEKANRELALSLYPELAGKTVVLYAPTFRKGTSADYSALAKAFPREEFALIIKPHPNQRVKNAEAIRDFRYSELTTMQALDACDVLITDFSAISFEGAVLNKPIYFYLFDYEDYVRENGVNINPYKEMPSNVYEDAGALIEAIREGRYDREELEAFRRRYLPEELGVSTKRITRLIVDCMKEGKHEGIRKNLHREDEADVPVGGADSSGEGTL